MTKSAYAIHRLTIFLLAAALIAVSTGYYFQQMKLTSYERWEHEDMEVILNHEAVNSRLTTENAALKARIQVLESGRP